MISFPLYVDPCAGVFNYNSMCKTLIKDNYFIEYQYTDNGQFRVDLQELRGSKDSFFYLFKVIRETPEQYLDLIDDAIFWHEMITLAGDGSKET